MRIHFYLEIDENKNIRCLKCGHIICKATENYKLHVPRAEVSATEVPGLRPEPDWGVHYEYYCPGCYTMLDVEQAPKGNSEPLWDIQIKLAK